MRIARIQRRVLETRGDSSEIPFTNDDVKNSQGVNNNNNNNNGNNKILYDFAILTDPLIPDKRPDLVLIINKRTCDMVDFAVSVDNIVRVKEGEKLDKYLDLARELKKKLWNRKVTVILIVVGAQGTFSKNLEKGLDKMEIRKRFETIPTKIQLKSAKILRKVLETCGDLLSLRI